MATTAPRDEFLRNLLDGNLFPEEVVNGTLSALAETPEADGEAVARRLIAAGKLTAFQADAVREGRLEELRIGNYQVLDRLGAGGMGTVFKARHRRMKRVVALKVLSRAAGTDDTFVQRFQREVEVISRLSHPNIVMAFDADEAEVGHFLVMEFVDGRDLASEVQRSGPLPVPAALDVILQAARGLEYAHAQGIIHRDIKPANLLREPGGLVKVTDLGLARFNSTRTSPGNSSLTQVGGILGTLDYMPPEQALDATATDHRADVYSLGGTLHFLLTGRPPYVAESLMALLLEHSGGAIPSLRAARPDVPAELDALFQKMLAKAPGQRPASMTEVVRALEAVQALPLPATRPAPAQAEPGVPGMFDATVAGGAAELPPMTVGRPPSAPPSAGPAGPAPGGLAGLSAVLVEPSRTQAGIVRKYLQQLGLERVETTGSGQEALALARRTNAGVLLSAMHLSDMTGTRLAHALRAEPGGGDVGFVLLTSQADAGAADALPAGPRTVLLYKPFDLPRLAEALARAA